jgi:hypothetical protein
MSRGGLLLRCVQDQRELRYAPVAGAVRHGPRPPRLVPRRYSAPGAAVALRNRADALAFGSMDALGNEA